MARTIFVPLVGVGGKGYLDITVFSFKIKDYISSIYNFVNRFRELSARETYKKVYTMKQNTKDWLQYGSALAMLVSAIVLAVINFLLEHLIHSSVLVYVSEALAFVAAVYGIATYTNHKIRELGDRLRDELRHDN